MTPRDDVVLSYSNIPTDTTVSGQTCPKCKGGHHQERSMSVGKHGAFLWWRCHRASCGFGGKEGSREDGPTTTLEKRGVYREFKRTPLPFNLAAKLSSMYSIHPESMTRARWSYTPDYAGHGARVIFPILSPDDRVRGEQFRSYSGDLPKALTNGELKENLICWYKFKKYAKNLVIVEDIPSALRVAEQEVVDSLALMGTVLNFERIQEIREQEYKRVWLALDKDATANAIRYKKQFQSHLPSLKVMLLEDDDIKDMSKQHFDLFLQEALS